MKIKFILIIALLFSCKNDVSEIETDNPFKNIKKVENQVFNLNKLNQKEIIGNKGTKINFSRNDFEIGENDSIVLELKEYYSLDALISDNIQTITTSKELLESNGVIYLNFTVNGEKIKLKENKKLNIQFPIDLNKDDRIYKGEIDSDNQIFWTIDSSALTNFAILDSAFLKTYRVDLYKEILIPIDSLEFYKNQNERIRSDVFDQIIGESLSSYVGFFVDDFGWINIDKIINPDAMIDFELISNNDEIQLLNIFILYKDLNSFISFQRDLNHLKFNEIPLKNETSIVVVGKKEKLYYANKIELNSKTNGKIKLSLKEIDSTELKSLIKK